MQQIGNDKMEKILPYDKHSPTSIEEYSSKLIGKTFSDVLYDYFGESEEFIEKRTYYNNPRGKGSLGTLIEKYFFGYEPNSDAEPDFPEAGVELKVTPYEELKKGTFRAGERLVIGMIPNNQPIAEDINDSHVLEKLKLVLLVLYLRDKKKERITYPINYSKLFSILHDLCAEDLAIIESDYKIISEKIIQGKAHELSESDTMYLGACTKGATASKSLQPQFYNTDIPAKRRAFSLKQGYVTALINKYIFNDIATYEPIFANQKNTKQEFEEKVVSTILVYKGKSEIELRHNFNMAEAKEKDIFSRLTFAMLGIKSNMAEEFEKSNTIVKTIRISENGKIKENMSFPAVNFIEFVQEDWDDSYIYNYFSENRFLFVVFKEQGAEYKLENALFWNMPFQDLDGIGKQEWLVAQKVIKEGVNLVPKKTTNNVIVNNNLPKSSETIIFHMRPHTAKSAYLIDGKKYGNGTLNANADLLPNGDMMTKQSFWLNNHYVLKQILKAAGKK